MLEVLRKRWKLLSVILVVVIVALYIASSFNNTPRLGFMSKSQVSSITGVSYNTSKPYSYNAFIIPVQASSTVQSECFNSTFYAAGVAIEVIQSANEAASSSIFSNVTGFLNGITSDLYSLSCCTNGSYKGFEYSYGLSQVSIGGSAFYLSGFDGIYSFIILGYGIQMTDTGLLLLAEAQVNAMT